MSFNIAIENIAAMEKRHNNIELPAIQKKTVKPAKTEPPYDDFLL
jgi:hypothetical protein